MTQRIQELIRILHQGHPPLKTYALEELTLIKAVIPQSELEFLLGETDLEVLQAFVEYAHFLSEDQKLNTAKHLLKNPHPQIQKQVCSLMHGLTLDADLLKLVLAKISTCADPVLMTKLIPNLQSQLPLIPLAYFEPLVRHPNPEVQAACLEILKESPAARFRPLFQDCIHSKEPRVRSNALVGLWRLGEPIILQVLETDPEGQFITTHLHALGETGQDPAIQKLLVSYLDHVNPQIASQAALSLGKTGNQSHIQDLLLRALHLGSGFCKAAFVRGALMISEGETARTLSNLSEIFYQNQEFDNYEKSAILQQLTPSLIFEAEPSVKGSELQTTLKQLRDKRHQPLSLATQPKKTRTRQKFGNLSFNKTVYGFGYLSSRLQE
jgi:hypothetical protein